MIDKEERKEFENNFKNNLKSSVLNIFKENASNLLETNKFTTKELEFIGIRATDDKEFNDYLESLICVMMDNFEDCLEEVEYEKSVTRRIREEYHAMGEIIKGYGEEELYEIIENHLKDILEENDINTDIIDFQIIGSRNKGVAKKDSDLDVLFEYNNDNIGEDCLFNIFNDEDNKLYIDGIEIDFNPITEDKSGSIDEWLTRNYNYNKYEEINNDNNVFTYKNGFNFEEIKFTDISNLPHEVDLAFVENRKDNISCYLGVYEDNFYITFNIHSKNPNEYDTVFENDRCIPINLDSFNNSNDLENYMKSKLNYFKLSYLEYVIKKSEELSEEEEI